MKKEDTIKTAVIILGIVAISAIFYLIYNLLFHPKVASKMDDFSLCYNEYTQVAEFYYSDFKQYDADVLVYSIITDKNEIICYTEGYEHIINVGESECRLFSVIYDSYYLDKQPLDYICVYDGFVSFCNNNGRASYVYSINAKKPKYIKSPNELKEDIHVRNMIDNWYFVCETY